jgi:hypothetical protein
MDKNLYSQSLPQTRARGVCGVCYQSRLSLSVESASQLAVFFSQQISKQYFLSQLLCQAIRLVTGIRTHNWITWARMHINWAIQVVSEGVIGCLWDDDSGSRDNSGSWEAGSNCARSYVWLYLLLVQNETMSCLVACMNEKFWSLAHGPVHHTCTTLSCIAREGEIEKTDPYGIGERNGRMQANGARHATKQGQSGWYSVGWAFGRSEWGNQSPLNEAHERMCNCV